GVWLHQIVEYLIAAALILMSAQSRHSFVVAGDGIARWINGAIADGPRSAYTVVPRNIHRIIDWLFIVALFAGSFLLDVDQSTRTTLFAMAVAIIVIALTTNYTKKVFRQP
ncbi:MAG: hypothetical protein ACKOEH_00420, partial [Actinomycetota bacterium]